jgi:hypothetical protein
MSNKENILKKEFDPKDVQRLRNLITKKYGDKTTLGVGYEKEEIEYKEGDEWEDNGKKWTIKNGIKQNVTKLDKLKELAFFPLLCPNCSQPMNHKNDKLIYNNHKKCFNCLVEYETELKRLGLWDEYEKKIHNEGIDKFIANYQSWVEEIINDKNQSFVTEQGDIENWIGGFDLEKIKSSTEASIKYLESLKK